MQAIILATGEQQHLPPLTDELPGPLLPVIDRPVMATSIEMLARAGQKHLLISLYNQGGPIAAYFGSGKRWGVEIEYVTQRESWGSAGSLKWAAGLLTETILVLPGDVVIDLDVEAALAFHQAHGGVATAILASRSEPNAPLLYVDADDQISATTTHAEERTVTGAFLFEPRVLEHIPARAQFDILSQLLPALRNAGEKVYGYTMQGYWNPLCSLSSYHEAQQVFLYSAYSERAPEQVTEGPSARVRYPSLGGKQVVPGVWVGLNHSIHPSVKLAAPVFIGENTWIGREVELGAGTVLGANVVIDDEATVSKSTVLDETYVGQLVRIENRIVTAKSISDPESGETTLVVDPFLISHVGEPSGAPSRRRRTFSQVGATLILISISPVYALAWILAFITGVGKPIVRTKRVGQRVLSSESAPQFYTFDLMQFRTRTQRGGYTLIGRWLERWEIYRLPELFNVLRGDMEIVGVKPLRPEEVSQLNEEWHQRRHDSPAGFTGLWYQQTEPGSDLDTVMVADVYYTATRTWRGDLMLVLRTPTIWARRHLQQSQATEMVSQADTTGTM